VNVENSFKTLFYLPKKTSKNSVKNITSISLISLIFSNL